MTMSILEKIQLCVSLAYFRKTYISGYLKKSSILSVLCVGRGGATW